MKKLLFTLLAVSTFITTISAGEFAKDNFECLVSNSAIHTNVDMDGGKMILADLIDRKSGTSLKIENDPTSSYFTITLVSESDSSAIILHRSMFRSMSEGQYFAFTSGQREVVCFKGKRLED